MLSRYTRQWPFLPPRVSHRKVTSNPPSLGGFSQTAEKGLSLVISDPGHATHTSGHQRRAVVPADPGYRHRPSPSPGQELPCILPETSRSLLQALTGTRRGRGALPALLADISRSSCESKNKLLPNPGQHRGPGPARGSFSLPRLP